jgi:replicative DNA helicase
VLAADSSTGKTALALQFAYHMASRGKKVLFFSLETPREKLEDRLMSEQQVAGVAMLRSKKKALTREDYLRSTDVGMRAGKIPLRMIRRAETLAQIENRTIMHGADVIFIDYLQIINHRSARGRVEAVAEISMELHRMANRLGVTVVALSQVTPPDSGEITIQDLRESNQIKQDAEVILLLMKDKTFPGARKLKIGKDKDGAANRSLLLSFDPQHMTFSYAKRKEPAQVPGQGAAMWDLEDDGEGGDEGDDNPFNR